MIRWGALAFAAVVVAVYIGSVIHRLQAQHTADQQALVVARTRIHDLETASSNLHVTVTNPTPTVNVAPSTITVTPPTVVVPTPRTTVVPGAGTTVIVPTPGPTVVHTPTPSPPAPSPGPSCGLLGLGCLLRVIGL